MSSNGSFVATLIVLLGLGTAASADPPIELSSCRAIVPPHRTAVLTTDVECGVHCTADPSVACSPDCPLDPDDNCQGDAIVLGRGATLRLAGHTIVGAYNRRAIGCSDAEPGGTCTVSGPGVVQSTKGEAISSPFMNVRVRDLTMNGSYGAIYTTAAVDVRRSTFGSWDSDIYGARSIRLVDSTSLGHDGGLFATETVSLVHVTTGSSVHANGRIVGNDLTLVAGSGGSSCPELAAPIVRVARVVGQGCSP